MTPENCPYDGNVPLSAYPMLHPSAFRRELILPLPWGILQHLETFLVATRQETGGYWYLVGGGRDRFIRPQLSTLLRLRTCVPHCYIYRPLTAFPIIKATINLPDKASLILSLTSVAVGEFNVKATLKTLMCTAKLASKKGSRFTLPTHSLSTSSGKLWPLSLLEVHRPPLPEDSPLCLDFLSPLCVLSEAS